jgi:hypothetical protein
MCTPDQPFDGPMSTPAPPPAPPADQPNSQSQAPQTAAAATIPSIIFQQTVENLDALDNQVKTVVDEVPRFSGSDVVAGEAVPPPDRSLADALRSTAAIGEEAGSNVVQAVESNAPTVVTTAESQIPTVVQTVESEIPTVVSAIESTATTVVEAVEAEGPAVAEEVEENGPALLDAITAIIAGIGMLLGG